MTRQRLPETRSSIVRRIEIDKQYAYLVFGLYDDGSLGEFFIHMRPSGDELKCALDWGATMFSVGLQHGADLHSLTSKMRGTRFEPAGLTNDPDIPMATSVLDYAAQWIEKRFG